MITKLELHWVVLALLVCAVPVAGQEEVATEGAGWVLVRTDLEIGIDPALRRVRVKTDMTLRLEKRESSPGPDLGMNARSTVLRFDEVTSPGAERIEINVPHPELEPVRMAQIRFAEPFERGDEIEVVAISTSTGEVNQFTIARDIVLASWVVGWYPAPLPTSSDEPSSELMKAPGRTTFFLPRGWRAVSNGALSETRETEDGVVETWQVTVPVARSFAAAPFKTVSSYEIGARTVGVYAIASSEARAEDQARVLVKALEAMEARFGPYPFPSYYIVEVPGDVPGFYGSSEQGFIMTKPDAFIAGGNIALFAHEAAHGWWGNLVASRGDGAALISEGLSQYSAVLAFEAIKGEVAATEFLRFSQTAYSDWQCAKGYFRIIREGHDRPLSKLTRGEGGRAARFNHHLVDSKGMWVYHMLRREVGDEIFFATVRDLIEEFAGKSLTLDGLRQAFVEAAPEADLVPFFAQWLDRAGAPVFDVKWKALTGGKAEIFLDQVQKGEPYRFELEVSIETKDGRTKVYPVDVSGGETRVQLAVDGGIKQIRLDPNHQLLIWQPEYGARP